MRYILAAVVALIIPASVSAGSLSDIGLDDPVVIGDIERVDVCDGNMLERVFSLRCHDGFNYEEPGGDDVTGTPTGIPTGDPQPEGPRCDGPKGKSKDNASKNNGKGGNDGKGGKSRGDNGKGNGKGRR